MIPHRTPFLLPLLYPSLLWRMPADGKAIYLTFDDGPVPGPTEFALDHLRQKGVSATFFCIGDNIRKHPQVFGSIIADRHAVGNHTFHHVNGWKTTAAEYIANTKAFDDAAVSAGLAQPVTLFRPPYGRISRAQIRLLNERRIVMWDVLSQDYDQSLSPERCLRGTLAACRAGSIVVFHDSHKAMRNMEYVVPRLIEELGSKGYTFKRIPEGTVRDPRQR